MSAVIVNPVNREIRPFDTLKAALDFMATLDGQKVKGVHLNVNLKDAKYDKYNRLLPGDYPWLVSYPVIRGNF